MKVYHNENPKINTPNAAHINLERIIAQREQRKTELAAEKRLRKAEQCLTGVDPQDHTLILRREAYSLGGDTRINNDEAISTLTKAAKAAGMKPWTARPIIEKAITNGAKKPYDPTHRKNLTNETMTPYFNTANNMISWSLTLKNQEYTRTDAAALAEAYTAITIAAQKYGQQDKLGVITFTLSHRQWLEMVSVSDKTLQRYANLLIEFKLLQKSATPAQHHITRWSLLPPHLSSMIKTPLSSCWAASEASTKERSERHKQGTTPQEPLRGCSTLPRMQDFTAVAKLRKSGKYVQDGVGAKGRYLLALMSENLELSVFDMAEATGFSVASIRTAVNRLLKRVPDLITVSHEGNLRRYTLNTGFSEAAEVVSERDNSWVPGVILKDYHHRARMGWFTPWWGLRATA